MFKYSFDFTALNLKSNEYYNKIKKLQNIF